MTYTLSFVEDAIEFTEQFTSDPRYSKFLDDRDGHVEGRFGFMNWMVEAIEAFNIVNSHLDGNWWEAMGEYVCGLYRRLTDPDQTEALPDKDQMVKIAQKACAEVRG